MPAPRLPLFVGAAALSLVLGACTGDDQPSSTSTPSAPATPLASFSTDGLVAKRQSFCELVSTDALSAALGSQPKKTTSYGNGEPAHLTDEVKDVAHEYGCVWRGKRGATARAWVFAPPVTRAGARSLARQAAGTAGCSAVPHAPAFGAPSTGLVCRGSDGPEVSYHGLFGDAWLTCSLALPDEDRAALIDRAGRWCVAVATAASA